MSDIYRIDIPINVDDNTEPALGRSQQRVSRFEQSIDRTGKQLARMNRTRWQMSVQAVDRASAVVQRVNGGLTRLTRGAWSVTLRAVDLVTAPLRAIGRMVTSVGGLIAGGALAYGGVFAPLQMADDLTRANIGFTTFLGSAAKAKAFLADIQKFGADTPFESDWLTGQATTLLPALGKDAAMVMRTLKAFGDAGALTGATTADIEMALLGFRQVGSVGTLSMEELRQVTENLRVPLSLITEELGVAQGDVKDLARLGIPATKAMDAILRALERPVSKGGFLGGMAGQMETLSGQVSLLKDNVKVNLFQRWGQGLESGAIPLLKEFNGLFTAGADRVKSWGDGLERAGRAVSSWFVGALRDARQALSDLMNSPEWANADTLGEKLGVAWDKLVVERFDEWWGKGGEGQIAERAARIGTALGSGIGALLSSALGVASGSANDSPFVQAGATAGKAFLDAFLQAFDAQQIAGKLAHEVGKVAPGGESPTAVSWLGVGGALWAAKKGIDVWTWMRGVRGAKPGVPPILPGPGNGGPGVPSVPTPPTMVKPGPPPKQLVDRYGNPLTRTVPPTPTGPATSVGRGALREVLGLFGTASLVLDASKFIVDYTIGPAVTAAILNYDPAKDPSLIAQSKAIAEGNRVPTSQELAPLRNTPAVFTSGPPKLSFWENLFLPPWAKQQRDLKWAKEQQAALAGWKAPVVAGMRSMSDQEEQDALRRAFRAARAVDADVAVAPPPASPPPKTEITVDYRPQISITTAADAEDVLRILKANHAEVVDDIASRLADGISMVRQNMPRVRHAIAE